MTEAQKDALRIVLNLANHNRLDPDDFDVDDDLHEEAREVERAINLVARMLK